MDREDVFGRRREFNASTELSEFPVVNNVPFTCERLRESPLLEDERFIDESMSLGKTNGFDGGKFADTVANTAASLTMAIAAIVAEKRQDFLILMLVRFFIKVMKKLTVSRGIV